MNNLERYNMVFVETFGVDKTQLNENFNNQETAIWDSVAHMNLISMLEENFDIFMDTEDIMELTSYSKGKDLLGKYGISL